MAAPKKRRDAERELKKKGFKPLSGKRGKGSHEVWQNKDGVSLTVPTHGDEIAAGTWRSIDRQAGQAQQKAAADAAEAQRLANEGVNRPGTSQGRASGQQNQQGQQSQQGQQPGRRGRGRRGGRG
jgi:predicted RNA binding protein YcfA (HicA-like mRNA interferase family)